jgi:hypothetical protein
VECKILPPLENNVFVEQANITARKTSKKKKWVSDQPTTDSDKTGIARHAFMPHQ